MKKLLCCVLSLMMLTAFAACGSSPAPAATSTPAATDSPDKGIYTPGTYTATAAGMGTVTVTATFDASSITDVELDVSGETEGIGQAAGDTLKQQIMDTQSADIDGVSGATVTSTAVKTAMADCLSQAKG